MVIDLHSHILPGLDDGPRDSKGSIAMAWVAIREGIRVMVATPHVSADYDVEPEEVRRRAGELTRELARAEIPLAVLPGAEVAVSRLPELDDARLRELCLGPSSCLLIESPYERTHPFLAETLFELQVRGFRPILAHPERCPLFQSDIERLHELTERGILCSVTGASMAGAFGSTVRDFATRMFREGLVHDVATDAHDAVRRPPHLTEGFERANRDLPGLGEQRGWYTVAAPVALLGDNPLPPRPEPPQPSSVWSRLARTGRRRRRTRRSG